MTASAEGVRSAGTGSPTRVERANARIALWLIVFFSFISLVAIFLLRPHGSVAATAARLAMPLLIIASCLAGFLLSRRGRTRLGAGIVVAVAYAAIVNYVVVWGYGLHSYTVSIFAILVAIVSMLIGYRAGLWACAVALATVLAMYALQRFGRITDAAAVREIPLDNIAVVYCVLIGSTGAILCVFSKVFHETLEAAAKEEQRFRTLIDLAPMGYVVHRDGRILMANRAATLSGGYERPEDMVGKDAFGFVPEGQREAARQRMDEARVTGVKKLVQIQ
jgi:PAS domain-containing protein